MHASAADAGDSGSGEGAGAGGGSGGASGGASGLQQLHTSHQALHEVKQEKADVGELPVGKDEL